MTEHSTAHAGTKRTYAADRTTQVQVRVTPAERDAYDAAAEAAGVSRSEWLRALAAEALSAGEATDPAAPPTRT